MPDVVTVLSIDGGGIHGLIPALVLEEIEKLSGQYVSELFDLLVGTSTGGIIALALTASQQFGRPMWKATDVVKVYEEDGRAIFDRSFFHAVRTLRGASGPVYPAESIEGVLRRYFQEVRLSHAVTEVMASCYDLEERRPYFFKSYRARHNPDRDCLMWQAARATSAAPWYFPPYRLDQSPPRRYRALVDGGVFANNPAFAGLTEARKLTKSSSGTEYLVVSLGTGNAVRRIPFEQAVGWGAWGWLSNVIGIMLDGSSSAINHQMEAMFDDPRGSLSYYRFQCSLSDASGEIDDASDENLRQLRLDGERLIRENRRRLEEVTKRLVDLSRERKGPRRMLGEPI
jgi:patatin-like phospholipase/acyl hydrolase